MENGKKPAFSVALHDNGNALHKEAMGLTKHEYFAGLAMQGMMANQALTSKLCFEVAKWSVEMADAILAELEKTKKE